ncbi:MAG TPA: ECF-type sigma factor [Steroidobacteraceae bacterium]|nr:ECF-type sigma factor [Steroidobacteraceae bacterium]
MESITQMLDATRAGDRDAAERLFGAVYAELRLVARSQRRRWVGNHTMNTTALIHEAFIKLAGNEGASYANRTHFYATAAKAMRQILVNYAEQQRAAKRGGDVVQVPLEEAAWITESTADELIDIERLLAKLEVEDARRCRIVECRLFGGLTVEETAEALGISPATVKREWQVTSAALYRALHPGAEPPA